MAYEPTTIRTLTMTYQRLQDKGVNAWYGEAGGDLELAKMILDGATLSELMAYCQDYGYIEQEDED
jgi:hypothetical protein